MTRLPVIDTGSEELDAAIVALMEAATAVRPTSISPSHARSILRLLADAESACDDDAGRRAHPCRSCTAVARMSSVGMVLLHVFFKETP